MGLLKTFFNNTGRPAGFLGRVMLWSMNWGHAPVADWGMGFISGLSPQHIADIGCGGGRNAAELLRRFPGSSLTAVDYSEESIENPEGQQGGCQCRKVRNPGSGRVIAASAIGSL